MVDTLLSALDGSGYKSRLRHLDTDVPLPGNSADYANGIWKPAPPSLSEMRDRLFSEAAYDYSSGAYKIEAARILGTVLDLDCDTFNVTNAQVETIDASIQAFLLSLPPTFRDVAEVEGKVDEVLFAAHMIINWASIALHRPRSNLAFVRNHYATACSSEETVGMPALSFQSHTSRTIRAANAISKLTAIQTSPALHTPCFACAIALSATVYLPAYTMADNKEEIKERLHLSVSALAAIGAVWPLADIVRAQLAQFARETFKPDSFPKQRPASADTPSIAEPPQQQEVDLHNMLNDDSWLNQLDAFTSKPVLDSAVQAGWS